MYNVAAFLDSDGRQGGVAEEVDARLRRKNPS